MKNFSMFVSVVAIALTASAAGCKKKEKTGTAKTGSGSNMMGSGSADMGSGSAMATGSDGSGSSTETPKSKALVNMVPGDLKWMPMDPTAGDKGPQFAPLWGDPMSGPNGFIIKVPAANPGVAHVHTNGYHGITISGGPSHVQNGGKKAEPLPAPSYWFEPGGAPHTSQCLGKEECMALVHFNDGKMDFAPKDSDKAGKPDAAYVEKRAKDSKWMPMDANLKDKGPQFATVWGDPMSGPNGFFIKIPAGFTSPPHTHDADYHAVVIEGIGMNYTPDDKAPKEMGKGSYFMQPGMVPHITACKAGKDCLGYVYMTGKMTFNMADGAGGGAGSAGSAAGGDMKGGDMKGGDMKGSADAKGGDMKGGDMKGGDMKGGDMKGGDKKDDAKGSAK